jgi:hypothetical protein
LDNGYNNYMTRKKDCFVKIDECTKFDVLLRDDKEVEVNCKRTIAVKTKQGQVKHINYVLYVPPLAQNLLSVGKLKGYLVGFKKNECIIYAKENNDQIIAKINMLQNIIFSFKFYYVANRALKVGYGDDSWLWHVRYENLNIRGLKLPHNKKMAK